MRVFAIGVEHALDMPVQGPQHTNPRMHQRPTAFGCHDQRFGRGLPYLQVLLRRRQLHDVAGSIFQRRELAMAEQVDRIFDARDQPLSRIGFGLQLDDHDRSSILFSWDDANSFRSRVNRSWFALKLETRRRIS
jgi:hypothetical protein